MDKQLYNALVARIQQEAPSIKFIDLELGQLEAADRPPVAFPCMLIDINYAQCVDLGEEAGTLQRVEARIIARIAFSDLLDSSGGQYSEQKREKSLKVFDVVQEVQDALQGWSPGSNYSTLSRDLCSSQLKRGIKIIQVQYSCTILEI